MTGGLARTSSLLTCLCAESASPGGALALPSTSPSVSLLSRASADQSSSGGGPCSLGWTAV